MSNKQDTSVRVYSSVGSSAVLGYNLDTSLIFQACIAGYGQVDISSVVVDSVGVATITTASDHNFFECEVVQIAGSDTTALNDIWKINSIVASNVFTILTDFSAGTITGTMTVKVAPLIHLTQNTNTLAFAKNSTTFTITKSTTSDSFSYSPISGSVNFDKAATAGHTNVPWRLICNEETMILLALVPGSTIQSAIMCGKFLHVLNSEYFLRGSGATYNAMFNTNLSSSCQIKVPNWLSPTPSYMGYANTDHFSTGVNAVDNKRVYIPALVTVALDFLPGVFISIGAVASSGLFPTQGKKMLHFLQSNGYGICVDILGPWK